MSNVNMLSIWIHMDDSIRAKALLKVAIYSKLINAKWLARWCIHRISTKHMTVSDK